MKKCRKGQPGPHYWIIAGADGPNSFGECQNCHWGKAFVNSLVQAFQGRHDQAAAALVSTTAERRTRAANKREEAAEVLVFGDEN